MARTMHNAYSGFVHGASPHIMDRYGGYPPQFYITGMLSTLRIAEYKRDFWNYVYRTFISHVLVAKTLCSDRYVEVLTNYLRQFERNAGKIYS